MWLEFTHHGHDHLDLYGLCDGLHSFRDLTLVYTLTVKSRVSHLDQVRETRQLSPIRVPSKNQHCLTPETEKAKLKCCLTWLQLPLGCKSNRHSHPVLADCCKKCSHLCFQMEDGISSQGFIWVTLNLVRPITMELGARPPSIYELLTREHIIEQSTQHIAFYMPRDTVKSMHITRWAWDV